MSERIISHRDLDVFRKAFDCAMDLFEVSRTFPKEETYSLTEYEGAFISKLSDAESEAAETQVWIEFAVKCGYLDRDRGLPLFQSCDQVLATLVGMINHPETWIITPR